MQHAVVADVQMPVAVAEVVVAMVVARKASVNIRHSLLRRCASTVSTIRRVSALRATLVHNSVGSFIHGVITAMSNSRRSRRV
eukprot:scaffold664378_cov73-Prasinocladus_malaysianus.AAC.1